MNGFAFFFKLILCEVLHQILLHRYLVDILRIFERGKETLCYRSEFGNLFLKVPPILNDPIYLEDRHLPHCLQLLTSSRYVNGI